MHPHPRKIAPFLQGEEAALRAASRANATALNQHVLGYGETAEREWVADTPDGVLEPGMVICVESYIGRLGGREGVKIEEQILVTETGFEQLSVYPLALSG